MATKNVNVNSLFSRSNKYDLLEKDDIEREESSKKVNDKCPEININIESINLKVLVGTGANCSVLSQKYYQHNIEIFKKCAHLPISGR